MTRLIFLMAGLLLILLGGLAFGARAIGQRSTPLPAYLDPGECEQPCWQGIQPGIHTRDQFMRRVSDIGVFTGRATDYGDGVAAIFEITPNSTLTLADVWREFGPPKRVHYEYFEPRIPHPWPVQAKLYYVDGLIEVSAISDNGMWLSPDMEISAIRYFSPGEPVYGIGETYAWRGFASLKLYR